MDSIRSNESRTANFQSEIHHAAFLSLSVGTNSLHVDLFIDVGHGLHLEGSILHMGTPCSI
jgi:hypothetical protein